MYRATRPIGVPVTDTGTSRQTRTLNESAAFKAMSPDRRETLTNCLALAIERAEYHYQRFRDLRNTLDIIRAWAPGEVFWDFAVSSMYCEVQALAGAARVIVDQMLFLMASRIESTMSRRRERRWEAHAIFNEDIPPGSETDIPEVHRIRRHKPWLDLLNAYRNGFFHGAWQHGSGHYDNDGRIAARLPRMNALLVPDRASLAGRGLPWDWTWADNTSIDEVATRIHDGIAAMVNDICVNEWNTDIPAEGSLPVEEHANLIIALPVPALLQAENQVFIPIFSSEKLARQFASRISSKSRDFTSHYELIRIKSSADVVGVEAISFSLLGLDPTDTSHIHVYVDPEPLDDDWSYVHAVKTCQIEVKQVLADAIKIVSIPVEQPQAAFIWRTPMVVT